MDSKELHFENFFSLEMSLFQVFQVDEMQYLGRCSKHYHHRPRTMKKLKEFRPQDKKLTRKNRQDLWMGSL